jgi:hypothetical protein
VRLGSIQQVDPPDDSWGGVVNEFGPVTGALELVDRDMQARYVSAL